MRLSGLAGRVAVVTGAASGIGRAIVHRLAREEVRLAAVDVHEAGLRRLLGELDERTVRPFLTDLTDPGEVAGLAVRIPREVGDVSFLVNVAGGPVAPSRQDPLPPLPERAQPIEQIDDLGWSRILATNLTTAIVVESTPSHCSFSNAETLAAWESLRTWVETGGPQPTAGSIQALCTVLAPQVGGPCRIDPTFVIPDMDGRIRPR